jgi:hypothetical protein
MVQQRMNLASSSASNHDILVMGTAEDAMKAIVATVKAGYYEDLYINRTPFPGPIDPSMER